MARDDGERAVDMATMGGQPAALAVAAVTALGRGSMSEARLAERLGLEPERAHELLDACVRAGLVERSGDRYANSEAMAGLVDRLGRETFRRRARSLLQPLLLTALLLAGCAVFFARTSVPHAAPQARRQAQASSGPAWYLVASEQDADAVATGYAGVAREAYGAQVVTSGSEEEPTWALLTPNIPVVDVVDSPAAEVHTDAVIASANVVRGNYREPLLHVIDLRPLLKARSDHPATPRSSGNGTADAEG